MICISLSLNLENEHIWIKIICYLKKRNAVKRILSKSSVLNYSSYHNSSTHYRALQILVHGIGPGPDGDLLLIRRALVRWVRQLVRFRQLSGAWGVDPLAMSGAFRCSNRSNDYSDDNNNNNNNTVDNLPAVSEGHDHHVIIIISTGQKTESKSAWKSYQPSFLEQLLQHLHYAFIYKLWSHEAWNIGKRNSTLSPTVYSTFLCFQKIVVPPNHPF